MPFDDGVFCHPLSCWAALCVVSVSVIMLFSNMWPLQAGTPCCESLESWLVGHVIAHGRQEEEELMV
jgi:hypothetical protein